MLSLRFVVSPVVSKKRPLWLMFRVNMKFRYVNLRRVCRLSSSLRESLTYPRNVAHADTADRATQNLCLCQAALFHSLEMKSIVAKESFLRACIHCSSLPSLPEFWVCLLFWVSASKYELHAFTPPLCLPAM